MCGLVYRKFQKIWPTCIGEVLGTSMLGGLCAYPVAILLMGVNAGQVAFYAYIIPFFVSTAGGSILAGAVLMVMERSGVLGMLQKRCCQ